MPFAVRTRADVSDKHASDVNTLIYHKNRVYSGAADGKIKVWDEDLKLVGSIDAHSSAVLSIVADDNTLYSCSNDGTLKEWTLPDLKLKQTLLKSENELWKLCFTDGLLYVGDNEGNVQCFFDDKLISMLNIVEPVKDMLVNDRLVYTVRDLNLVITELYPGVKESYGLFKTIKGRAPLCIAGERLFLCSRNGKDILVHENSTDLDFKEITHGKDAHEKTINALCGVTNDRISLIYSGGMDKMLKQWKVFGSSLQKQNACPVEMCINAITAGPKGEIFVGGSDGHIVCVDC